ncbi:IS3 family transposase [Succinivibrio dextrinosolvens]|uniref:IS3 family transposase n=1 Tax=Succinivibrio dextrinosolvens TaxID=83771 RepID=UPI001EEEA5D7|nr:IS3 family transposase [Succinivibrio dextrinosolvens]
MKLSYEDKIEIYRLWKEEHIGTRTLAKMFGLARANIEYLNSLIDIYGISIAKKKTNRKYSKEFKEEAIKRVLLGHESQIQVSLSLALPNRGMLPNWIKSYKENNYNVIVKKRGRYAKEETIEERIRSEETNPGASEEERAALNRERILKKIRCLNYRARKARVEEIAKVISELRQELKCSLNFILYAINSVPDVPHMTRSDYYYTLRKTDKDEKNKELIAKIKDIYQKHKQRYGYRRITLELARQGIDVNHKKVQRLMQKLELKGITPRVKYKSYKGDFNGTVKNQLLDLVVDKKNFKTYYNRNFTTTSVNQKWTTDVSEFYIKAGKLYLSPILDMHNGEIVSYSISAKPNFRQTIQMLERAFKSHKNLTGLILHSDQGWQYQMSQYHKMLKDKGIIQSMSRKGNCLDNCVMENFFGKMKNEMFYGHEYDFKSLDELRKAMEEYIEYYNTQRIQVKLKGRTPCEVRNSTLKLS